MANIDNVKVLYDGPREMQLVFNHLYVDTALDNIVLVDKDLAAHTASNAIPAAGSAHTGQRDGAVVDLGLVSVQWSVNGFDALQLEFDHTTDGPFLSFVGEGFMDFPGGLRDWGTGGTGDMILTAMGTEVQDDGFTLIMKVRKYY